VYDSAFSPSRLASCTSINRPMQKATPMPTLRGWWMPQNTSTSATKSGAPTQRPQGIRLSMKAHTRLNVMNSGLTGSRM